MSAERLCMSCKPCEEQMHFDLEEYKQEIRAEVIDELTNKAFCEWTNCEDCAMWGQYDEFGEEEICVLEQLKEQNK